MNTQPQTMSGSHFHAPEQGTMYSAGPRRAGLPADLTNPLHYPVEALCRCREVIRCERPEQVGWVSTGRRAGEG